MAFVKDCMPGRLSYGIVGLAVLAGAPLLIWVGKTMEDTFGKFLFIGFGVLGFLIAGLMLWAVD